ncbi:hypothetical protein PpBr36_08676 [Pyricularia pennisetigena]|uniref:hypothetical protein n=1 Tax=Pyricularia pennisetigena TaxID=1578925 RepID=UPI00114D6EAB|nr:hypothetical protein PpBr36_08676 [Pyricularia pennisetigena]TLS24259.1 hypothetical protein PpBr36_08676 [Pyricularia pennisetigena]
MARIVVIRDRGGENRNSGRSLGHRGPFYLTPVEKRGTSPSFGQVATCVRNIPGRYTLKPIGNFRAHRVGHNCNRLGINDQPAEAMTSRSRDQMVQNERAHLPGQEQMAFEWLLSFGHVQPEKLPQPLPSASPQLFPGDQWLSAGFVIVAAPHAFLLFCRLVPVSDPGCESYYALALTHDRGPQGTRSQRCL